MSYKLHSVVGVDDDVSDPVEWYESQQDGLGERFIDDWESTVAYILSNPFSFAKKTKSFRQAVLKNFPYLVVYEITDNIVIIYAVINGAKHPKKRFLRKK
ncbi:MAG: type II toxin-antitoxin system RelE/ParE family toxin [Bacteroidetes bacterium]|nr:type II toxin-antitoxin system RelE/ParE family toxin [Bacteroidota bacterium]